MTKLLVKNVNIKYFTEHKQEQCMKEYIRKRQSYSDLSWIADERLELPAEAAVFLLCKGMAVLE